MQQSKADTIFSTNVVRIFKKNKTNLAEIKALFSTFGMSLVCYDLMIRENTFFQSPITGKAFFILSSLWNVTNTNPIFEQRFSKGKSY